MRASCCAERATTAPSTRWQATPRRASPAALLALPCAIALAVLFASPFAHWEAAALLLATTLGVYSLLTAWRHARARLPAGGSASPALGIEPSEIEDSGITPSEIDLSEIEASRIEALGIEASGIEAFTLAGSTLREATRGAPTLDDRRSRARARRSRR